MTDGWEQLALQLRKEIGEAADIWVRWVWRAFWIGILIGAVGMWAVLYFHVY